MLVERRISTKINYDVLRDIEIDSSSSGNPEVDGGPSSLLLSDLGHMTSSSGHVMAGGTMGSGAVHGGLTVPAQDSVLTITRTLVRNRLPSLSSRKRNFSSLSLGDPSHQPHPLTLSYDASRTRGGKDIEPVKRAKVISPVVETMEDVISSKLQQSVVGVADGDVGVAGEVIEESGPVEYCEGEGLGDEDIEDLVYEDDPLLAHSDYEDCDEY